MEETTLKIRQYKSLFCCITEQKKMKNGVDRPPQFICHLQE